MRAGSLRAERRGGVARAAGPGILFSVARFRTGQSARRLLRIIEQAAAVDNPAVLASAPLTWSALSAVARLAGRRPARLACPHRDRERTRPGPGPSPCPRPRLAKSAIDRGPARPYLAATSWSGRAGCAAAVQNGAVGTRPLAEAQVAGAARKELRVA